MQSSIEDAAFLAGCEMVGLLLAATAPKQIKKVNPYLRHRRQKGRFERDFEDLIQNEDLFKENFHMSAESFNDLYTLILPKMDIKRNTHPNDAISAKEKLAIVLEYFACGTLQRHVASQYRISKQYFGTIVTQICDALISALAGEIPALTPEEIRRVASTFEKWNFPNCAGALDGKHVAIKRPPNSGSLFYNYKGFYSLVLMAAADGDYKFTYLDIGAYGSEGDAGIFQKCTLGKAVMRDTLQFPEDSEHPFVFVGDDAFPLHKRIMKPFVPTQNRRLEEPHHIFNYRLSRARRCIENAFGILCAKFYCLARKMFCGPEKARKIVIACCYLHNFLIRTRRDQYCPSNYADDYNDFGDLVRGEFRSHIPTNSFFSSEVESNRLGRIPETASEIRSRLMMYFNSSEGSIPWQHRGACLI